MALSKPASEPAGDRLEGSENRGASGVITEDVSKYEAEQGVNEDAALAADMAEKLREFVEKDAEVLREGVSLRSV